MKRRLMVLGVGSTFLLTMCVAAIFLAGIVNWFSSSPEEQAKPTRIIRFAQLPPSNSAGARVTPTAVKAPPGLIEASVKQPPVTRASPTATPSPTATASPTATPSPTATAMPVAARPGIATRLVIPKLSLDAPVLFSPVQNGTWMVDHLYQAVGHLEGTAPPGSDSNMVLAGHVTLAAGVYGPFANLGSLAPGDIVIVYEGNKEFHYLVSSRQTVDRTTVDVVYPSETAQITLITCINWNGQEGRYSDRLVIKGRLIEGEGTISKLN